MELIGHILGFIAVVFFFIAYQIFDKKKLLITQTIAITLISVQYLLIGAYSGCVKRSLPCSEYFVLLPR